MLAVVLGSGVLHYILGSGKNDPRSGASGIRVHDTSRDTSTAQVTREEMQSPVCRGSGEAEAGLMDYRTVNWC